MNQLPIRKLTLYKQGIGFFEREGNVDGTTVSLVVSLEGINDVLKSLNVSVQKGGKILGIDYETPEDKQKLLDALGVKLKDRSGLVDLLSSLRGSRTTLKLQNGREESGRLVGVEVTLDPATHPALVILQNDEPSSELQTIPINELTGLSLHDSRAITDLGFFLDVNRTEQTRTTLTLRLTEGEHTLNVSYLAPTPTWRVGYRLISIGKNEAQLYGWGLFENHLDEDLDQVELTLVSGRPISFEYELYESYVPSRPQVSDDPMSLDSLSSDPYVAESIASITHELRTPLSTISGYVELLSQDTSLTDEQSEMLQAIRQSSGRMNDMLGNLLGMSRLREDARQGYRGQRAEWFFGAGPLGDLKVSSAYMKPVDTQNAGLDLLTYDVETPVSVQRGQSAMVPIINETIRYKEICVFNGDKMPNHPLRVWLFTNETGQTLEQGPVTIIKEGQFAGDGLIRLTGVDDDIQIPFALEFGILVKQKSEWGDQELLAVKFDGKKHQAIVSRYQIAQTIYTLTSHLGHETAVYIEQREPNRGEFFEMPEPALAEAGHTRWMVTVPAQAESTFAVRVREITKNPEDVMKWNAVFIETIGANNLVSPEIHDRLEQLLAEREQNTEAIQQRQRLSSDYDEIVSRQNQLRQNLGVLGETKREGKIREQILDDLEASENRRRELEKSIAELSTQIQEHQEKQQALLDEIFESD